MMGILLGIAILFVCYCLGRLAFGFFKVTAEPDEQIVFGTGLGLGLLIYAVLILGLFNVLTPPALAILLGILLAISLMRVRDHFGALWDGLVRWRIPFSLASFFVVGLSLITFLSVLAGVHSPETANDALCYHLNLPKIYLAQHRIGPVPFEINSVFPLGMEMLYTLGLALHGVTLAKFFHVAMGLVAAGAVLMYARRRGNAEAGWWAALLFLTTPGIVNEMATTYIDVGLTAYTALALIACLRWQETGENQYLFLCGVFSGLLLSMKYLGLIAVLALALLIVMELFRKKVAWPKSTGLLFCFGLFAAAFSVYWYLRAYCETGNPVYPYFYRIFKSGNPAMSYDDIGVGQSWSAFMKISWTLTMHPEKFEGFGVQLGSGYLAFLPLALVCAKKISKPFASLCLFCAFYLICWFCLGQSLRFLYPMIPALAIFVGWGIAELDPGWASKGIRVLFVLTLLLNAICSIYHYRKDFRVASGLESREAYLSREERSFRVAQFVNQKLPPAAKILNADETHMFYFNRAMVRESVYADRTGYFTEALSLPDAIARLKHDGFTHILFVRGPVSENPDLLPALRIPRLLSENQNQLAVYLDPIYTYHFTAANGEKTQYTLYRIL